MFQGAGVAAGSSSLTGGRLARAVGRAQESCLLAAGGIQLPAPPLARTLRLSQMAAEENAIVCLKFDADGMVRTSDGAMCHGGTHVPFMIWPVRMHVEHGSPACLLNACGRGQEIKHKEDSAPTCFSDLVSCASSWGFASRSAPSSRSPSSAQRSTLHPVFARVLSFVLLAWLPAHSYTAYSSGCKYESHSSAS